MIAISKSCDVSQGFNFKPDERVTFGFINTLVIANNTIAPDLKVTGPSGPRQAVAVLETVEWSTLPNESITLRARVSLSNAQLLTMLAMQSLKKIVMNVSFVVYQYDLVANKYFTAFKSYAGVAPGGVPTAPGGGGFGTPQEAPIYALVGKTSGGEVGLKVGTVPQSDPPGMPNCTLELVLAPPIASQPQQLVIQTSDKNKLIQPWGLPQV